MSNLIRTTSLRSMVRNTSLVILSSFLIFLHACSVVRGFSGGSANRADLAIVRGHGVFIERVNQTLISDTVSGVLVLPGRNEVDFTIDPSTFNSRGPDEHVYKIIFEAAPGTQYVITGQRGDGRLCAWPIVPESGDPDFSKPAGCAVRR